MCVVMVCYIMFWSDFCWWIVEVVFVYVICDDDKLVVDFGGVGWFYVVCCDWWSCLLECVGSDDV